MLIFPYFHCLIIVLATVIAQDAAVANKVGVASPEAELDNATLVAVGTAYKQGDAIYFRPFRILKRSLALGNVYQMKGPTPDEQTDQLIVKSLASVAMNEEFVLIGGKHVSESGTTTVYPPKFDFSVWPQGMKRFEDFPYKSLEDCVRFIERQLGLPPQPPVPQGIEIPSKMPAGPIATPKVEPEEEKTADPAAEMEAKPTPTSASDVSERNPLKSNVRGFLIFVVFFLLAAGFTIATRLLRRI